MTIFFQPAIGIYCEETDLAEMAHIHLTRVAFGCSDLSVLAANIAARAENGEVPFTTRHRPRRAAELIGGYLHFIIRHTLVARVEILRFDNAAEGSHRHRVQ